MKKYKTLIFSFLLATISASAQYNNGNYNGYNNGYRSMRNTSIPSTPQKVSAESIEKERMKEIEKIVSRLKEELNLDELQVIAIRNEVTKSNKSIEIVMKSEISEEDKNTEYIAIQEKADKSIISYLNAAQKEKYQKWKEDSTNKKDQKKKRKDKEIKVEQ
jgi:hypothetical protein